MSISAVRTEPKYSFPWPRPFWPDAPELRRELVPNGNWYWRRQNLRHHFALVVIAGPANSRCGTEKQSAMATGDDAGWRLAASLPRIAGVCLKTQHDCQYFDTLGGTKSALPSAKTVAPALLGKRLQLNPLCYC